MAPPFEVATFDNYGTLTDWEGGAAQFLYELALRNGDRELVPGIELRNEWEEIQFDILGREYRSYKEVLAQSLAEVCRRHGWPYDEQLAADFVRSMRSWQPFPDTYPALQRAHAAGMKLVIFSNTDRDIIEHSLRHMRVPFHDVITAEDCRIYKPSNEFFRQALDRVGVAPEKIIHVAFGFKYDNAPAKHFGMRTAWVNRHIEPQPAGEPADYEWRDLWGLAELADGCPVPR
ncbi:2-haloacid dehalogenase/putative hydrolase of the HAD superfamily [Tamaricihabitans halophyticus]|uniref:2-haloacid dehalogenase/putative hydrolase of the HAD superfamily n=1 Tax=Tamaricihabitans halophyticus TaxID=1262583 RepID=A0A4R2R3P2_9PSEU|nr:haloacid dehalogenase type II [Tamaricihabitans halophyticus]TCP56484.1 2-haloacid dehalogenase/putative hydrolase of the HAD superfamily [Tamaricihabitans halophyticus]